MSKFMSITKLVEYFYNKLKANNFFVSSVTLYFEDKKCFINKYHNSCIKPVFIEFRQPIVNTSPRAESDQRSCSEHGHGKSEYPLWKYMIHKEILDEFGDVLIISFKESKKKTLPTEKNGKLYCMNIDFYQISYKGINYYPTVIEESTCEHNKKNYVSRLSLKITNQA